MGDRYLEIYDNLTEELNRNSLELYSQKIVGEVMEHIQNNCLKSELSDIVNSALDVGIKIIFPNSIGDSLTTLKNNIYNYGFKDGLGKTVDEVVNAGKSALGILTNDFTSISQAKEAIKEGGALDKISNLFDDGIKQLKDSNIISKETYNNLKNGKKAVINNVEQNIEKSFETQFKNLEKLEKYITNWNGYYGNQDFSGMEKEFNKMKKVIDSLLPIENTLTNYRKIYNLQNLIKNNGKNFDLSNDEIELANKLVN